VNAVDPSNIVVTAGTAPYGDPPGTGRTQPLPFWRGLLCLNVALRPVGCPVRARFDVLGHNPINTVAAPTQPPDQPEDLTVGNFDDLAKLLRAAEHGGRIGTRGAHPIWATEFWFETDPPDPLNGIPARTQARWLEQSLYLLWRAGASAAFYLSVRDAPYQPGDYTQVGSSGILYEDGTPKPALTAFRFPFVTSRVHRRKLIAWGRAPAGGRLRIRSKAAGHWETIDRIRVKAGAVFKTRLPDEVGRRLRAEVGTERSLAWRR